MSTIKCSLLAIFLSVIIFFSFIPGLTHAQFDTRQQKQVTIVNPIRGKDFWNNNFDVLETSKKEYAIISRNNLPATWLVRYDALVDPETVSFLNSLNDQQEVGLFLEITPTFSGAAGVKYNQSDNWHWAKSLLLTGYSPQDRKKLIDTAIEKYNQIFHHNPTSVGAWWIDAYSLAYLKDTYSVEANLDVSDQYSTDQYQVWGQYWSLPFYPAKNNALFPAPSPDKKIGIVTIQWATRDPINAYGNGVGDSTFSVQVNDYLIHGLDINYFKQLLSVYPQTTIGLENDFSWEKYGLEYSNQINLVREMQNSQILQTKTMSAFAKYYSQLYPEVSPDVLISSNNPLGGDGKVVWYQTPKYRIGWFYDPSRGSRIRDLRIYDESTIEPCFNKACETLNLAKSFINAIDEVTYNSSKIVDEGRISDIQVKKINSNVLITYKNQVGHTRSIKFMPNDIEIDGKVNTLSGEILEIFQNSKNLKNQPVQREFVSSLNFSDTFKTLSLNLVKFIGLVLMFFYLPGILITKNFITSIPVGIALFTFSAFILRILQLEIILWGIPVISGILFFHQKLYRINFPKLTARHFYLILLITLGSVTWLLTVVKSGLNYSYGLGFWGPNGHDAIWHLALINQLLVSVPPNNPIYSGQVLSNYHYFYDLLLAQSSKMLGIGILDLFFRLFPLLISVLTGFLVYKLSTSLFNSYTAGFFSTFFVYFGGSFGWVSSFLKNHTFGGESAFWSQQAISTLLNPPFAISILLFLSGICLFEDLIKTKIKPKSMTLGLIITCGVLIEYKAYGGVLLLLALAAAAVYRLVRFREFFCLVVFLGSLGISLLVFLPNNANSSSLLIFQPLWLVDSMIDFPDRLGWERLTLAHQPYIQQSNYFKYLLVEVAGIVIFILGNLGTRFIFIYNSPDSIRKLIKGDVIYWLLITIFLAGLTIPLLFIQKGANWNIVQFLYYSILISSIFAGGVLANFWEKKNKIMKFIVIVLMLLTIPSTYDTLSQYLPNRPPAKLSDSELEALAFLKTQPDGVILTLAFDNNLFNNYIEPRPLFTYASSGYVSAFSGKQSYLEDTINLDILDIQYKGRLNEQKDVVKMSGQVKDILKRNNIKYIYVVKAQGFAENELRMGIKKIFDNEETKIFQVL